jgi:hypothetical protein
LQAETKDEDGEVIDRWTAFFNNGSWHQVEGHSEKFCSNFLSNGYAKTNKIEAEGMELRKMMGRLHQAKAR